MKNIRHNKIEKTQGRKKMIREKEKIIKKQNHGITLIALVITIIIMLILVAVTINIAVNGDLFKYAKRAVNETRSSNKCRKRICKRATWRKNHK